MTFSRRQSRRSYFLNMRIPYFKQQKDWWCGPAVMQMALASFGVKKTQVQLTCELKTKKDDIGTKNKNMLNIAKSYLPKSQKFQRKRFTELRKNLARNHVIILSYFYEPDKTGHFAIVKKITRTRICLLDPEAGPNKSYGLKHFKKIWHDNEGTRGWFLVIRN